MSRKTCSNHVSAAEGQVMHNLGLETFNSWVTKRAWAVISKDHIHGSSYFLVLAWLLFTGNLVNLPGIVVLRSTRSWVSIYNGKDDTETLEAHHWPEVRYSAVAIHVFSVGAVFLWEGSFLMVPVVSTIHGLHTVPELSKWLMWKSDYAVTLIFTFILL